MSAVFRCPWQSCHAHSREYSCISSCPLDKFRETNGPDLCRVWSGMHKSSNSHRCYYYETLLMSLGMKPVVRRWLWYYHVPLHFFWCSLVKPQNIKLDLRSEINFLALLLMVEWGCLSGEGRLLSLFSIHTSCSSPCLTRQLSKLDALAAFGNILLVKKKNIQIS